MFIFGFVKSYILLVLWKAVLTLVVLNKSVNLCNNGLYYLNVFQVSEFWGVLLSRSGLYNLCCNCEFSLWISVGEELLAFAMCCIVSYSFCFRGN